MNGRFYSIERTVTGWVTRMAAVLGLATCGLATPTSAEMVREWQNHAYYPARVIAVHWPNTRLDARTAAKFGAWTIRFGSPLHFALFVENGGFRWVHIAGDNPDFKGPTGTNVLRCSNAAIGE